MTAKLILLHPSDNILVCVAPIAAGEAVAIDGTDFPAPEAIPVGHKVARGEIAAGAKVLKYGAPIGSITYPVKTGAWVHMHNMKSDYIATHTRKTISEGSE